jgi:peptide deformylase
MPIKEILKMGDPRLLRVAKKVEEFATPKLASLLVDMTETMRRAQGVGLAAPQIGENLQVVMFGTGEPNPRYPDEEPVAKTVLINPVITPITEEMEEGWEGCLSVPGLRGRVPRWKSIRYSGVNEYGEPFERVAHGFHARMVQHECDHLWGILYPMRIKDFSQFGFTEVLFPGLSDSEDD